MSSVCNSFPCLHISFAVSLVVRTLCFFCLSRSDLDDFLPRTYLPQPNPNPGAKISESSHAFGANGLPSIVPGPSASCGARVLRPSGGAAARGVP